MTVQQLRYIVTLDQERHFARAAELCSVTQPGLTIQLKNLEEEIGVKIFDRSRVPLKPTAIGEEIITEGQKGITGNRQHSEPGSEQKERSARNVESGCHQHSFALPGSLVHSTTGTSCS